MDNAYDSMKEKLFTKLKDTLRPELLNRLDDIVIFRSLTRKDARKIVELLLSDLNRRLRELGFKVVASSEVFDFIVQKGFSDEYGARPLRRTLQDYIENLLADYLLSMEENEKSKIVEINLIKKDNKIEIK